jgi:hypothetical protein
MNNPGLSTGQGFSSFHVTDDSGIAEFINDSYSDECGVEDTEDIEESISSCSDESKTIFFGH